MTNQKGNVLTVLGREFALRTPTYLTINEAGEVEPVTLDHLFIDNPGPMQTLMNVLPGVEANAQVCADRAQGRGVPMNEFKIQIDQEFEVGVTKDDWHFEFTLIFQNGEEADDDSESETLPE